MLRLAQVRLHLRNWPNVSLTLAGSRRMPVRSGWADFAIEGWAFLQIAVWHLYPPFPALSEIEGLSVACWSWYVGSRKNTFVIC